MLGQQQPGDLAHIRRVHKAEVVPAGHRPHHRAQRAGTVRDDIGVTELIALLVGTSRALEHVRFDPKEARPLL